MSELVAIVDAQDFRILFANANPMRVTVRETSKLTSWPVEDGTQRTDHRVIDPIEIDLPLVLTDDTRNLFEALRNAFLEGRELIIQTKVRSYPAMMITDIPHDEIPDQGDSIPVAVKLKQVITIKPEFGVLPARSVANVNQSSTVKKGVQQTEESPPAQRRRASTLYTLAN